MTLSTFFSKALFVHGVRSRKGVVLFYNVAMFLMGPFALFFLINVLFNGIPTQIADEVTFGELYPLRAAAGSYCSLLSSLVAVVAACTSCARYYERERASYYEALPFKRITAFISDNLAAVAVFAGSLFLHTLISALTAIAYAGKEAAMALLLSFGYVFVLSLGYFLTVYAIFLLCGQLAYKLSVQLILGISTLFYLPLIAKLVLTALYCFDPSFDIGYYDYFGVGSSPILEQISFIFDKTDGEKLIAVALWLLFALAATVLSAILFRKRKIEDSGKALSFLWVRYVVRVAFMLPIGIFCGISLYNLSGESFVWCLIGTVIGILLVHMIINAVIFKSLKKLLYGPISFLSICFVGVLLLSSLHFGFFGIGEIPDMEKVDRVEISSANYSGPNEATAFDQYRSFVAETAETKELIYRFIEDTEWDRENYRESPDEISVVFHTGAFPLAKRIKLDYGGEEARAALEALWKNGEYVDYRYGVLKRLCSEDYVIDYATVENVYFEKNGPERVNPVQIREKLLLDLSNYKAYSPYSVCRLALGGGHRGELVESSLACSIDIPPEFTETISYLESLGYVFDGDKIVENTVKIDVLGNILTNLDKEDVRLFYDECCKEEGTQETTVWFIGADGVTVSLDMDTEAAYRLIAQVYGSAEKYE